jgi:hypothetical protein
MSIVIDYVASFGIDVNARSEFVFAQARGPAAESPSGVSMAPQHPALFTVVTVCD